MEEPIQQAEGPQDNKRNFLITVAILTAASIAVAGLVFIQMDSNTLTQIEKIEEGVGSQIYEQVQNPVEKIPSNPYSAETNPFEETKTNPFEGVYKNPFD